MKIAHFPNNLPNNAVEVYPQLVDAIQQTDTLVEGSMDADARISQTTAVRSTLIETNLLPCPPPSKTTPRF